MKSIEELLESIDDTLAVWAVLETAGADPNELENMKEYLQEKARQAMNKSH